MGWHGSVRSRIRYPLLANAVQRLLTAMVGQDREEANRAVAKWELTSRIRDESNVPNAFHSSRRSWKRYSAETVPQPVTASQGTTLCKVARNSVNRHSNSEKMSSQIIPLKAPADSQPKCAVPISTRVPAAAGAGDGDRRSISCDPLDRREGSAGRARSGALSGSPRNTKTSGRWGAKLGCQRGRPASAVKNAFL